MVIYLVRHGQTDANIGKVVEDKNDTPLNEFGVEQAKAVRGELKDINFAAIYASPFRRTRATAEIINELFGLPIQVDERIRERFAGKLNDGRGTHNMNAWAAMFDADDELIVADAENLQEFFDRVHSFIEDLKAKHSRDEDILVVTHGGVQHAFYAYFNNLPLKGNMRIDKIKNAEVKKYNF
jgi:broad specificity phosphatase PhoE